MLNGLPRDLYVPEERIIGGLLGTLGGGLVGGAVGNDASNWIESQRQIGLFGHIRICRMRCDSLKGWDIWWMCCLFYGIFNRWVIWWVGNGN